MDSLDNDYATPQRLAIYLEIGWSDFLLAPRRDADSGNRLPYPNPLCDYVPPSFPLTVAALARDWATGIDLNARSFCDIGGATGRTLFEFERQFPDLEQLVLVEPSKRFCEWAQRLLSSDDRLPDVPIVDRVGLPEWVSAKSRPQPIARAKKRLSIVNDSLEHYRPQQGFDLVTCLNVVDRHPCPTELPKELARLMNDKGLLILSCPFDFHETSTPDRDAWIDDLNALFADNGSWSHVDQDEVFYEFRSSNRSWTRFCAQLVGKRWQA